MRCNQCGLENPKQSKFCRKCGNPLETYIRCGYCGLKNPGDSIFCVECGERVHRIQKSVKGTQRKCKSCGHFNELDALFCVTCGEETVKASREDQRREPGGPSYKTIALVIAMVFVVGFFFKLGSTFFKSERSYRKSSAPISTTASLTKVDEAQVIAVAKNFKCPCGGCGEDALVTCTCDMPKGAVETKDFIREKLSEGFTVEQVIELVDKKYGHRI